MENGYSVIRPSSRNEETEDVMSKLDQTTESRQAMPTYLDDPIERVARSIFAYRWPQAAYTDPTFKEEVIDCRLLAAQFHEILNPRWTLSSMVEQCEKGMGGVVFGDRGPSERERNMLRAYATDSIKGLFALFGGALMAAKVAPDVPWSIPAAQGIDQTWRQAFVATKFAEVLTALVCPAVPFLNLDVDDRTWLRGQTEQLVEDTVARFESHPGDPEYQPQDEPEYDFDGRSEDEGSIQ